MCGFQNLLTACVQSRANRKALHKGRETDLCSPMCLKAIRADGSWDEALHNATWLSLGLQRHKWPFRILTYKHSRNVPGILFLKPISFIKTRSLRMTKTRTGHRWFGAALCPKGKCFNSQFPTWIHCGTSVELCSADKGREMPPVWQQSYRVSYSEGFTTQTHQ